MIGWAVRSARGISLNHRYSYQPGGGAPGPPTDIIRKVHLTTS